MNKNTIGVMDVVQIVLIVLKLCHVINWSWWWVLSPSWGNGTYYWYCGLVRLDGG